MNFIEAVRALSNGECAGIRHLNWTQAYMPQYLIIDNLSPWKWFAWAGNHPFLGFSLSQMLSDDWELVNPTPETEEVEVKRWLCSCGNCYGHKVNAQMCKLGIECDGEVVELVGHYTRPVKRKVKFREEVTDFDEFGLKWNCRHSLGIKFFVEWEEDEVTPCP
jgi:hypothetical protein